MSIYDEYISKKQALEAIRVCASPLLGMGRLDIISAMLIRICNTPAINCCPNCGAKMDEKETEK